MENVQVFCVHILLLPEIGTYILKARAKKWHAYHILHTWANGYNENNCVK